MAINIFAQGHLDMADSYGVTAHPTAPANDIKVGYRFVYGDREYRVAAIIPETPGVVQAVCELI